MSQKIPDILAVTGNSRFLGGRMPERISLAEILRMNNVGLEMEPPPKVTRDELADLLEKWERAELSSQQVWDWVSVRYWPGDTEIDDWVDDLSATNEILALLDSMDINVVVVDDVAIHRRFLLAPKERTAQAHDVWKSELNTIDYKQRMKTLRDDPIFSHVAR